MLFRTLLTIVFGSFALTARATSFQPFAGPAPVAVLVQKSPFAVVAGAETPRIAIYENGDVIYTRDSLKQQRPVYFQASLGAAGLWSVLDHFEEVAKIKDLKSSYAVTDVSNQSTALFYLRVDGHEIVTSVYGLTPDSVHDAEKDHGAIPLELLRLYEYLDQVEFNDTDLWRPTYVEAMIWPFSGVSDQTIPWPSSWPGLHSPRALQRPHGWSIFLDQTMDKDLARLLSFKGAAGAVGIDNERWSVASRPVFPSEPVWREAFTKITGE